MWLVCVWSISFILLSTFQVIHSASLRCCKGTKKNCMEVSLDKASTLINTTYFNVSLPTNLYTFGYLGKVEGPITIQIMTTYTSIDDLNACLLNWENEANLGANYLLVVAASHVIAKNLATALIQMADAGMKFEKLALIGLSLGAHMFGETGREVISLGKEVPIILGLDPAYPGYEGLLATQTPLGKGDAKLVGIIHTYPGYYGMERATGDIDVYVNEGFFLNGTNRQPGCPNDTSTATSFVSCLLTSWSSSCASELQDDNLCSHNRGALVHNESLKTSPGNLQASKAANYSAWEETNGAANDVIYIKDLCNTDLVLSGYSGVYYMSTNPSSLYGRGSGGLRP